MEALSRNEQAAIVALLRERPGGWSWTQIADALLEYGSAAGIRDALSRDTLFADSERARAEEQAAADISHWIKQGLQFWTILDARYPARVRDIHQAPPFLFARGEPRAHDPGVSVVGSRKASPRGIQVASEISRALVEMGLTVIAGLALGIDTAAHEATLQAGGRTVAMVGTGINVAYPAANRGLQERIARDGLLLSQFWPDAPPQRHSFPMRNAVMSGYGLATIVVEAGERSGARIQARMAVEHGRPVILTDTVVQANEWARSLLLRPDVYQASSLDEVTAIVKSLLARPAAVEAALQQIAL